MADEENKDQETIIPATQIQTQTPTISQPVAAARPMKYCQNCGAQIDQKAVICPKCGVPATGGPGAKEPKSRSTAIILTLFLGGIGIHKLYLGVGRWWLYLLFCWTFIPSIIALVELIQYAMMSDETFHAKYG
jgi:hypothetical protein